MLELICLIIINALIKVIFEDNWKPFIVLVILYLFCSFMGSLSQQKTYCHLQIILQIAVGFLFILNHLSTCFCNQHPVDLLLHCFLCIFIEMITNNIDCLPDFLCKCVSLCFCIHHFFHNHFPFFWSPSRESFHWSLSGHYSLNQAQNGHFHFRRLPIYSLFIFACKKPCDHSTFLTQKAF